MDNKIQYVSPFKRFCITIGNLPTAYIESMSYYEGLTYLVNYLSNNVIPALNHNGEVVEEVQAKFVELKNYVDNYFNNLDVQEEINNKLDEMADSGELTDIIAQYLGLAGMLVYNTVGDMKLAENLTNGSTCETLGYYSINDGGSAIYKVREVTNEDVIDEGSIIALHDNTLVAELIIENDTVNVKQFGAVSDEVTDDSLYIQNAINSQAKVIDFLDKTYMINDKLTFKSKSYIGNNSTLILGTQLTSREHAIRNENYGDTTKMDNVSMEGITIINNSEETAFGFSCCEVHIKNCKFYGSVLNTHSLVDLYGNNSNSTIKDSYFKINVSDPDERGTLVLIRGFHGGITKNVLISNCYMEQNSKDELIWINAGVCPIEDVIVENSTIKSTGKAANLIWISNATSSGETTYIKNITFNNNNIIENDLQDRLFSICRTETPAYQNLLDVKNINISNNIINIKDQTTSTHTSVILYGYDDTNPELIVNNNKIIMESTNNTIEYLFYGKIKTYNNEFNLTDTQYVYNGCYEVKGDTINQCQHIGRNIYIIDNLTATSTSNAIYDLNSIRYYTKMIIKNSNITCTNLFANGTGNVGRVYEVFNNTINNSSHIYNNYGGDGTNKLYFYNNNVNDQKIVNNVACELHLGLNYLNGELIKGIPPQATTKSSCTIGTIQFTTATGKSIVRKISAGDSDSNWEVI